MNSRVSRAQRPARLMMTVTLVFALLLAIAPIPASLDPYRPDWVALCLIYWSMEAPDRFGIGTAWIAGLAMDVLYGTPLGEQALADSVLAFFASALHLRLRVFPRWQQALVTFALVGLSHLIMQIAQHATGHPGGNWSYWTSDAATALAWPIVYPILRHLHYKATAS